MKSKMKYFMFNKELDYQRGVLDNLILENNMLKVKQEGYKSRGIFISRILDSQEFDMEWHRIAMGVANKYGVPYKFFIYSSNSVQREYNNELIDLKYIIKSDSMSIEEKLDLFSPYLQKEVNSQNDVLLHDVVGRYLWIAIEVYKQSQQETCFYDIKISFPRQTWLSYLPDVYRSQDKDNFLERYLGIFQSFYEDMNDEIQNVPYLFDISSTNKKFLVWMSDWLDLAESYMWSEEQLRQLLQRAVYLYKIRGTRKGVAEFVQLFTGEEPLIAEYHQLNQYNNTPSSNLKNLLADSPYSFSVIIKEEHVKSVREYSTLSKIIEEMKPAHMGVNLIVIKPYIFLGEHSFLGINSGLSGYRPFDLDGSAALSFATVAKNDREIEREDL